MNLEELRSVQSTERTRDSIQHLRESFYEDVADYIAELQRRRQEAAAKADDPFESKEVQQLSDEIRTVRNVTEAVYERRLGKLLTRASLAAAEDVATDEDGLTTEERALFRDVVSRIEENKSNVLGVLEGVADGDIPGVAGTEEKRSVSGSPTQDGDELTAAESGDDATVGRSRPPPTGSDNETGGGELGTPSSNDGNQQADQSVDDPSREEPTFGDQGELHSSEPAREGKKSTDKRREGDHDTGPPDSPSAITNTADPTAESSVDSRTTVKITGDVDRFYGVDEREYDLDPDDVVTLPTENATPLLQSGTAERIE